MAYAAVPVLLQWAELGWQDACLGPEEQASKGEVGLKTKSSQKQGQTKYLSLRVKASETAQHFLPS